MGRPTMLTTSVSSSGQPMRAAASETEEGCGNTRTRSTPSRRTSVLPMPKNIGSPLARTTSSRPG